MDDDEVIQPSEIIIETEDNPENINFHKINPWQRFLARFLDYSLFNLFLIFCFFLLSSRFSFHHFEYIFPLEFLLWIPIEAFFLSHLGYTPGKYFLKTRVSHALHRRLDFSSALRRSFGVWLKGMGMGIPLISIFAMLYAYFKLRVDKYTSWDQENHLHVSHRPVKKWQIIVSAAIISLSVFLTCLFSK